MAVDDSAGRGGKGAPWFAFYPADFMVATMGLPLDARGAYLLLMIAYYSKGAPLPDDDRRLSKIVEISCGKWRKLRPLLEPFFCVENGVWLHRRIERELSETERRRARGSAAATARWTAAQAGLASKRQNERTEKSHAPSIDQASPRASPEHMPEPMPEGCPDHGSHSHSHSTSSLRSDVSSALRLDSSPTGDVSPLVLTADDDVPAVDQVSKGLNGANGAANGHDHHADTDDPEPGDETAAVVRCPVAKVVAAYHAELPEAPRVMVLTDGRRAAISRRWRQFAAEQRWQKPADGIEFFRGFFEFAARSKFLTGRTSGRDGRSFVATLDWLMKPENFAKVAEGNYHNEKT